MSEQHGPSIFVSHSSNDRPLLAEVVKLIEASVVVDDSQVVCSSVPGYGLPPGVEPIDHLRESVLTTSLVLFVVTREFLRSSFCAHEAGAAWAMFGGERESSRLFVLRSPDIEPAELPAVLQLQSAQFDSRLELAQLSDRLRRLGLRQRRADRWESAVTHFLAWVEDEWVGHDRPVPLDVAYVGRPHSCAVFYLASDREAFCSWYPNNDGQERWEQWHRFDLPGGGTDALTAASWGEDHTEVFALGRDGIVRRRWWSDDGWMDWVEHHPATRLVGPLSADSRGAHHVEVSGFRVDGTPVHSFRHSSGEWSEWYDFAQPTF